MKVLRTSKVFHLAAYMWHTCKHELKKAILITKKGVISITKNQIEYLKYLESRRSNLRNEEITSLRDERSYQVSLDSLSETKRANRAKELQQSQSLAETHRANLVKEEQNRLALDETARSHRAAEAVNTQNLVETIRSHKESESINRDYNSRKLSEDERSHKVSELELSRYHDLLNATNWANINLGYSELSERERHQMSQDVNATNTLIQKTRNDAQILAETREHNRNMEAHYTEQDLQAYRNYVFNIDKENVANSWRSAQYNLDLINSEVALDKAVLDSATRLLGDTLKSLQFSKLGGMDYEGSKNKEQEVLGKGKITLNGQAIPTQR